MCLTAAGWSTHKHMKAAGLSQIRTGPKKQKPFKKKQNGDARSKKALF